MSMDEEHFVVYESSIGYIIIVTKNGKVISLDIRGGGMYEARKMVSSLYPEATESITPFKTIRTLLDRYLQGREVDFEIEVDISQLGAFTQKVLNELRKIPFGETRSYGWLAKKGRQGWSSEGCRAGAQKESDSHHYSMPPCHT